MEFSGHLVDIFTWKSAGWRRGPAGRPVRPAPISVVQTSGWSKVDLISTPDNFKTAYGVSFSRSIVFRGSQGLQMHQKHVFVNES